MDGADQLISWPRLQSELARQGAAHDRDGSFPHDSLAALRRAGLLGLTAPRRHGGQGAGLAAASRVVGRVAEGCASTALILAMQYIHTAEDAGANWPEAARALLGREAGEQGALVNALRVEPRLGSPARGGLPETVARRTASGWRLDGRKIFSTGAPGLAWGLVFARTEEAPPRTGVFLVPMRARGVSVVETWDQLGMRASGSHDVVFEDVAVPPGHALELRAPEGWGAGEAWHAAWNAALIGALYTGVARAARDWVAAFLRARVPTGLGAPLATLPRMQEAVGAAEGRIAASQRLIASVAAGTDAGTPPPPAESGVLKALMCEAAEAAVREVSALAGNHALSRANPLERHLRDVLCARIHAPQPDAARVAAGRAVLQA